MKKIFTDNFDKCLMAAVFFVILGCYLVFFTDTLGRLTENAFLVMTALVGYRRLTQPMSAGTTESGDINITPDVKTEENK